MTDEDQAPATNPAEDIVQLTAKLKLNKLIMLGVLFISLATFSILLTITGYFYSELNKLKAVPPSDFHLQLKRIDKEINTVSKYLASESQFISAYHLRINLLQEECSAASSPELVKLYLSREADYQKLLDEMLTGSQQLADMTRGSKRWLAPYEKRLDALKRNSEQRASYWADKP